MLGLGWFRMKEQISAFSEFCNVGTRPVYALSLTPATGGNLTGHIAGGARGPRRHSTTWCDPHRSADRTGNLGKLEAGRAKHMVTHILRRFTVKPILFALPRTNKFGLEN